MRMHQPRRYVEPGYGMACGPTILGSGLYRTAGRGIMVLPRERGAQLSNTFTVVSQRRPKPYMWDSGSRESRGWADTLQEAEDKAGRTARITRLVSYKVVNGLYYSVEEVVRPMSPNCEPDHMTFVLEALKCVPTYEVQLPDPLECVREFDVFDRHYYTPVWRNSEGKYECTASVKMPELRITLERLNASVSYAGPSPDCPIR